MIEFRFVWDCETMEKVLQYRGTTEHPDISTVWQTVPVVLGVIQSDGKVIVNGDKK